MNGLEMVEVQLVREMFLNFCHLSNELDISDVSKLNIFYPVCYSVSNRATKENPDYQDLRPMLAAVALQSKVTLTPQMPVLYQLL